jgi:hypothetical protein
VQNNRKLASNSDFGLAEPIALSEPHPPSLQCRSFWQRVSASSPRSVKLLKWVTVRAGLYNGPAVRGLCQSCWLGGSSAWFSTAPTGRSNACSAWG